MLGCSSCIAKHTQKCHGQFNWIHPRTIAIMSNMCNEKVSGAFEINRLKTLNERDKTFKMLNRGNGEYVTTNTKSHSSGK